MTFGTRGPQAVLSAMLFPTLGGNAPAGLICRNQCDIRMGSFRTASTLLVAPPSTNSRMRL